MADAVIARSASERAVLWEVREGSEAEMRAYRTTANYDVSLARGSMEAYVGRVAAALAGVAPGADVHAFGHLGDDNLHLLVGDPDRLDREAVDAAVYTTLGGFGGSVSAEHGIGIEKKPYLHLSRTAEEIDLMRRLKRTLDPHGILNPGKIFD